MSSCWQLHSSSSRWEGRQGPTAAASHCRGQLCCQWHLLRCHPGSHSPHRLYLGMGLTTWQCSLLPLLRQQQQQQVTCSLPLLLLARWACDQQLGHRCQWEAAAAAAVAERFGCLRLGSLPHSSSSSNCCCSTSSWQCGGGLWMALGVHCLCNI